MEPSKNDEMYEELCMMTGKVNKDISYLYYLLVKDGSLYKEEPAKEEIRTDATVDDLSSWFDSI